MKSPSFLSWLFGPWTCSRCDRMHRRAQAVEGRAARILLHSTPEIARDQIRRLAGGQSE